MVNKIWDKMGYNSAFVDICKIFVSMGGLVLGHRILPAKFLPQSTLVAMATKFETKELQFGFCKRYLQNLCI